MDERKHLAGGHRANLRAGRKILSGGRAMEFNKLHATIGVGEQFRKFPKVKKGLCPV
jgi:hypothetical protein